MRRQTLATCSAVLLIGGLTGALSTCMEYQPRKEDRFEPETQLVSAPPLSWIEYGKSLKHPVVKQPFGAIAVDSLQGRLLMFGSDPYQRNGDNSVREYDPLTDSWVRHYQSSPAHSYRVDGRGRAIAGNKGVAPWAAFTQGGLVYDPYLDALVLVARASAPPASTSVPASHQHANWVYYLHQRKWQMLDSDDDGPQPDFTSAVAAYDRKRNRILAYADGMWELDQRRESWRRLSERVLPIEARSLIYSPADDQLLLVGKESMLGEQAISIWLLALDNEEQGTKTDWQRQHFVGESCPAGLFSQAALAEVTGQMMILSLAPDAPIEGASHNQQTTATILSTCLINLVNGSVQLIDSDPLPTNASHAALAWHPGLQAFFVIAGNGREPLSVWALRLPSTRS